MDPGVQGTRGASGTLGRVPSRTRLQAGTPAGEMPPERGRPPRIPCAQCGMEHEHQLGKAGKDEESLAGNDGHGRQSVLDASMNRTNTASSPAGGHYAEYRDILVGATTGKTPSSRATRNIC